MDDRTATAKGLVLPYGIRCDFDDTAYLRDDPLTRMQTWAAGIDSGGVSLDDAKLQEPLIRS
jgi:hypothetical protein